jgi:hypothetical protein
MASFGLFGQRFEPFLSPNTCTCCKCECPFHTLVIHSPALPGEHGRDPMIAIPAILACQRNDPSSQDLFVVWNALVVPLCRTWLTQDPAHMSLRHSQHMLGLFRCLAAHGRADHFFNSTSFRAALSREISATSFFSRAFSRSSSFNRRVTCPPKTGPGGVLGLDPTGGTVTCPQNMYQFLC